MIDLLNKIEKKINGIIFALVGNGLILIMLGILIVWTDFVLRLVVGIIVLIIAYLFFYGAYKIWSIKTEIKKHFSF